ncbi:homeobox protein onecut [Drosophila montana]|uniref:homeobox protein onecut n=1 Tax=Drosophila montana TaxID=40370 RepID=UPI00313BB3A2
MESMNELIDSQAFSQQLIVETSEFIGVEPAHQTQTQTQEGESECGGGSGDAVTGMKYVKPRSDPHSPAALSSQAMQTLIATHTDSSRLHDDEDSTSVVMVIDEMGHNNLQATYQIVPQQLQLHGGRSLPMSLLPMHQERHSPVDFGGSDISLDGLSVSTTSQIIAVKQEHKLVIVRENADVNGINRRASPHIDINMSNINVSVIDELSSDGGGGVGGGMEEVTLNQHHQQLLDDQHHHHQHHQHQSHQHQPHQQHHHQQYGHRLAASSSELIHHQVQVQQQQQQQQQRQHQRPVQLGMGSHGHGHHREALSVIVQAQEDIDEDIDEDEDDDDRDSGGQLLSPALAVDNALEHSTYQTLTSVNNRISEPGFSPTSYATLTPIQPLPPISTMSDKFAYVGHISGSASSSGSANGSNNSTGRISNNCGTGGTSDGSFTSLPMPIEGAHQGSLGNLSLSGLGGVQSPYSSYDKLPSLISPPPHNFASSPSHGLSGMVGSCDLHTHSSSVPSPVSGSVPGGGCDTLSPHSELHSHSHSHSPQLQGNVGLNVHKAGQQGQGHGHGHGHDHNQGSQAMQLAPVALQKQIICLSPTSGISDGVVVSDYESSYRTHHHHHHHHHEHELLMATSSTSNNSTGGRSSQLRLQHSPTLSPHSVSAGSVVSMSLHSPASVVTLPHMNGSVANLTVDLPVVVSLSPTPPPGDGSIAVNIDEIVQRQSQKQQHQQQQQHSHHDGNECNPNGDHNLTNITSSNNLEVCNISQQQNGFVGEQQTQPKLATHSPKLTGVASAATMSSNVSSTAAVNNNRSNGPNDMEEINTKELAQRISAELKRYSIPQAIFAQRVLCRSQGTLSDLLRNPKPWSKLKSGRETFRRMFKWLQEPEFQRMSALRMAAAQIPQRPATGVGSGSVSGSGSGVGSMGNVVFSSGSASTAPAVVLTNTTSDASHGSTISGNSMLSGSAGSGVGVGSNCRRKEEPHIEQMPQPKKPRLVFTDLQRRTLQAIFKETKRPSKEMQVTIARQLGLEPTTVGNFFMNARRRSMDKWRDDDTKNAQHPHGRSHAHQTEETEEERESNSGTHGHYGSLHTTAMSPLGNFDDEGEMDLDLEHHDFLVDDHDDNDEHDDML